MLSLARHAKCPELHAGRNVVANSRMRLQKNMHDLDHRIMLLQKKATEHYLVVLGKWSMTIRSCTQVRQIIATQVLLTIPCMKTEDIALHSSHSMW